MRKSTYNSSSSQGGTYATVGFDPLNYKVSLPISNKLIGKGRTFGTHGVLLKSKPMPRLKGVPRAELPVTASGWNRTRLQNVPFSGKGIPIPPRNIFIPNASSFGSIKF